MTHPTDTPPAQPADRTLLVTLTGRDRPGLTAALFAVLARHDVDVLDVEQVTVRGRLVLATLLGGVPAETRTSVEDARAPAETRTSVEDARAPAETRTSVEDARAPAETRTSVEDARAFDELALRRDLDEIGATLGVMVEVSAGHGDRRRPPERAHVTVLGSPLRPAAVEAFTGLITDAGGNIDRIVRLASYPVTSVEFEVSGADPDLLKTSLATAALAGGTDWQADVAVQPSGLIRRAKRLVVMDVDSTLVQGEVIEMLAARAGVLDKVAEVTEAAMRGELDFAESLRARVALLAGLPASVIDDVRAEVTLTRGARTLVRTLKRLDYRCAIVSGGFTQVTDSLAAELGLDHAAANTLEIAEGRLTGGLVGPILDRAGKADALRRFAADEGIPLNQTIAVGDGANDLDMIAAAGLGVAFNAKPVVRSAADTAVNVPYLDAILFLLGISRADIEAADAADVT